MSQINIALAASISGKETYSLSRSVLIEERTAIWCPSCAEIDPQLNDVQRSHGMRIAMVALHVGDEFENDASRERMEYQNKTHTGNFGTPSFFVDGLMTAEGYDSWNDVQRKILTQELSRGNPTQINVSYNQEIEYEKPPHGQLSILILEHEKKVPEGVENPGGVDRDRVLVGYIVVDDNGTEVKSLGVTNPSQIEKWSLIFIHEPVNGGEPYGVFELSNRILTQEISDLLFEIVFITSMLGAILIFMPKNKFPDSEEE
jgi:thiol-disulfide isomerase/thioredoxin